MTASVSNKITLLSLVAGLGLIGFFVWKKLQNKPLLPAAISSVPVQAPALNVTQKLQIGYAKDMITFSDAEVKKYAGWIDAMISEVNSLKTASKKVATKKLIYNADVLKSMSDANLKAVVNYWQKVRSGNIIKSPIFSVTYVDNTETIPRLLSRLLDLGY
jgi:hypothetical protein